MMDRICKACLLAILPVALAGCAENKFTRQNYDLIRVGSSDRLEVESALGTKYRRDRGGDWEYEDMDHHRSAWFYFDDRGVVTRKQWWSAAGLEHDSRRGPEGEVISEESSATTVDRN